MLVRNGLTDGSNFFNDRIAAHVLPHSICINRSGPRKTKLAHYFKNCLIDRVACRILLSFSIRAKRT